MRLLLSPISSIVSSQTLLSKNPTVHMTRSFDGKLNGLKLGRANRLSRRPLVGCSSEPCPLFLERCRELPMLTSRGLRARARVVSASSSFYRRPGSALVLGCRARFARPVAPRGPRPPRRGGLLPVRRRPRTKPTNQQKGLPQRRLLVLLADGGRRQGRQPDGLHQVQEVSSRSSARCGRSLPPPPHPRPPPRSLTYRSPPPCVAAPRSLPWRPLRGRPPPPPPDCVSSRERGRPPKMNTK